MADVNGKTKDEGETVPARDGSLAESAGRVLENLAELEPQLINAGIFDQEGIPVALTEESNSWSAAASELIEALETGSGEEFDSAHVASAEGEVFVVRESGLALVAVTSRFVLASLTTYDMRMALRDAVHGGNRSEPRNAAPGAEKPGGKDA